MISRWNQIKSEKIKNIFIKGGFPDLKLDECNNNDENDIDERDDETVIMSEKHWNLENREHFQCIYVNCDIDIMTSELCTVDDLIDDKLLGANLTL